MTVAIHAGLASGRWMEMSLVEQLANIGSEVGRATRAKASGRDERLVAAVGRALELFDLTLGDPRWRGRRREIARSREIVCDFLVGDNTYRTTAESLEAYFLPFAVAARKRREAGPPNPGKLQADADRAEIARLVRMSDKEREAYYLTSNRNTLRAFEDARGAG